jgi:hypothetical protein
MMRLRSLLFAISPLLPAMLSMSGAEAAGKSGAPILSAANEAELRLGEYACMGAGGTILIGLGFRVLPGRKYVSLDNKDGGSYAYDPAAATVTFVGGFLEGFRGENVQNNQFRIHGAFCGPA